MISRRLFKTSFLEVRKNIYNMTLNLVSPVLFMCLEHYNNFIRYNGQNMYVLLYELIIM